MSIYREFSRVGRLLFEQGLVSVSAGNLSVRKGEDIFITATGSVLGDLGIGDVVNAPVNPGRAPSAGNIFQKKPSVEIDVHRAIYMNTDHTAVVHAHTPTAIALSFDTDRIELEDSEGKFYIPVVPVISVNGGIASSKVAEVLPGQLNANPVVIIRGHGVFAAARTLMKACSIVSTLEFSSIILYRKRIFERLK
ncbi:MAG: class II aldolase/adducin family protein [Elusimicrobia bacterium]|nr:class II aldolase/adducin family protein [Elusimicrobiota bacterium]